MKREEINKKLLSAPGIPEDLYPKLPSFLPVCFSQFEMTHEKAVFAVALFGVLSGCIPGITGRYHKSIVTPHLYTIIVAPAGSGKSIANFVKITAWKLHEHKRTSGRNEDAGNLSAIKRTRWGLFGAADTSVAMFLQQLNENHGELIFFESEIDTLVSSFDQDWGNFSHLLRAAFHGESISFGRKEGGFIEIKKPRMSMVLTGTPEQFVKLLPSSENGLFSRILFYCFVQQARWISPKPCMECENPEEFFAHKAEEVLEMAGFLAAHPAEFSFTEEQWQKFDEHFEQTLDDSLSTHGDEANASAYRMGLIMFRLAMLFSALRKWENRDTSDRLACNDEDFNSAITIVDVLFKHTLTMLEVLPKSGSQTHKSKVDIFYSHLPPTFTWAQAIEVSKTFGWSERTVARRLEEFITKKFLTKLAHNNYQKNT